MHFCMNLCTWYTKMATVHTPEELRWRQTHVTNTCHWHSHTVSGWEGNCVQASSFLIIKCGWSVLNADEKSTNSILAHEPRRSRCSRMTFNIDKVASSKRKQIATGQVDVQPGVTYTSALFSRTISSAVMRER